MDPFEVILQRSIMTYKEFHEDQDPPKNEQTENFLEDVKKVPLKYLSDIIFREDCCHLLYINGDKKLHVYCDYGYDDIIVISNTKSGYEGEDVIFDDNFISNITNIIEKYLG